jgi:hypothetical protein
MPPNPRLALSLAALLAWAAPAAGQLPGGIAPPLPAIGGGLPSLPPIGATPQLGAPRVQPPGVELPRPGELTTRLPARRADKAAAKALAIPQDLGVEPPLLEGSLAAALPIVDGAVEVEGAGEAALGPRAVTREAAARRLLAQHPDLIEPDDHGQPVVRGEVLGLGLDAAALRRLQQAGFSIRSRERLAGLDLDTVVLGIPRGVSAPDAVRRLRQLDPGGQYDFNHLYLEGGAVAASPGRAAGSPMAADAVGLRIGLVDGSAAAGHPALAGARLLQRAFAPGGAAPSAHATAVASLIAGSSGPFRGAAPGATLYVADIYGPTPTGGSAEALARGLAWLAQAKVPVINVSLVGPPNLLLAAAVKALVARGYLVVAPVGNDGPAAAPAYPAAYPGVVAVTGVDARRQVLPEAGRGTHVDFAAPGSEMAAAALDGGFASVRGTSFAAPIAAGRLARRLAAPDPAAAARAVAALGREAVDLGPPGPDPIYGRGLVGADVRTAAARLPARTARK